MKANHNIVPFCFAKTSESSFDLHFSSWKQEDDSKKYQFHHKLSFRKDIVEVMRKGQVPFSLKEFVKLIEGKTKLIEENEELKKKYTQAKQSLEKINRLVNE